MRKNRINEAEETVGVQKPQASTDNRSEQGSNNQITAEDTKKIKDILSGGYSEFVTKLKQNAKDPKVIAILNLGQKDGVPTDEKIPVNSNASYACSQLIPTQSQIGLADSLGWLSKNNPKGAAKLINGDTSTFNENRILTANGKYIIDGHHRWSQVYLFNPEAKIPAINIELPGLDEKQILKVIQMAIAGMADKSNITKFNNLIDQFSQELSVYFNEGKIKSKFTQVVDINQLIESWGKEMSFIKPIINSRAYKFKELLYKVI